MSTTETTAGPDRPVLVLIDCRCGHPRCTEPDAYRMRGRCTNCGNDALLGLFSAGHEVSQGVLCRGVCPACGNHACRWDRLATPDETPGEVTS